MNNVKLYEIAVTNNIANPYITYKNGILELDSFHNYDSPNIKDINVIDRIFYICLVKFFPMISKMVICHKFDCIADTSHALIEYTKNIVNRFGDMFSDITFVHKKHPDEKDIRQIYWFWGKSNNRVHWID